MVIWSGWGILVVLVPLAGLAALQAGADALFGPWTYRQQGGWLVPAVLLASAGAVWILGRRLDGRVGRVLTDEATGERAVRRPRHALFFIRMEYWAVPLGLAAAWMAAARSA
jgi:hypothetical protein